MRRPDPLGVMLVLGVLFWLSAGAAFAAPNALQRRLAEQAAKAAAGAWAGQIITTPNRHWGGDVRAETAIQRDFRRAWKRYGTRLHLPRVCASACLIHTDEPYACVSGDEVFGVHYVTQGTRIAQWSIQRAFWAAIHPALRGAQRQAEKAALPGNPVTYIPAASVAGLARCE